MPCPPRRVNGEQSVQMIGHHDVAMKFDVGKVARDFEPCFVYEASEPVQTYFPGSDISEDAFLVVSANRDEPGSRLRVIELFQPDGVALRERTVAIHDNAL